ncbi:ABC transporter substrate-binding protein [Savagea sp. SN6]|uniref:ABC transporter substrate-binding protein n=1 Tax=Savagea serpentis TaxID=2785297 RepID=A0A8J7GCY3_9BACL|nr:ABC transporter substrate-binding protein [Savagea serpentis]MBF4501441.1 ABC transporter substrate-binding protein [Savagea serpentis]
MKKQYAFSLWMALFLVLAGCSAEPELKPNDESTVQSVVDGTTYPLTTTDSFDNEITLSEEPKRIVSLMPSNTEILFALDLDESIIGVSDFDDYPKEAETKEKIGGMEFNVEAILALEPDLVVAHELNASAADGLKQLRQAGIPVYTVANAASFDATYDTILMLGEVVNRTKEAEQMVKEMQEAVDEVFRATEAIDTPKRVFVETSDLPHIYTPGTDTFIDEMLSIMHAENVVKEQGWVEMSPEAIVEENPDVIVIMYDYVPNIIEQVKARPAFDAVKAVQQDAVVQVDENLLSRQGPRLSEGLRQLAEAVYPEAFHD